MEEGGGSYDESKKFTVVFESKRGQVNSLDMPRLEAR